MRKNIHALLAACWLTLAASAGYAQHSIVDTQTEIVGRNLQKTVKTIQDGNHPLNRFKMTRVRKALLGNNVKGIILLLPPLGSGFQNYEVGENGDYDNSFVAYFASRNYEVWGYSQRVQGIPAGACESGALNCAQMENWGIQTAINDVTFIRSQIAATYPTLQPVIGGLSFGSILALATINAAPNDYAGALLIEGTIYDTDPAVQAANAAFCAALDAQLAAGIFYDGQGGPGIKWLSKYTVIAPNAPTIVPGFPPGTTNRQAFLAAMTAPPLSPLAPRPGYFNLAGSVADDRFYFADEALVHASVAQFVNYTALRTVRDINCGLAGDQTFTGNLAAFNKPVLMFAAGHGFGSGMNDTANLLTNAQVTLESNADYGHVDYVFSFNHIHELEKPILKWLVREVY